ncbi:hypothetical protein [Actinokineospora bangkokensis]|nr:hypothetical protein [Actinokineospora bangkokensis]
MLDGYRYLVRTIRYTAKSFLHMLTMQGGVDTAKTLLRGTSTSDGFVRLWEENMLAHSVEASVIKPQYELLFTDQERRTAQMRLQAHGFDVEGFLRSLN